MALASAGHHRGLQVPVHVKVDTGLSRYGLPPEEVVSFVQCLGGMPHLRWEGFWTHFAAADESDKSFTYEQMGVYNLALSRLEEAGLRPQLRHAANSAATIDLPDTHLDLVRPGISIYGLYPSGRGEPSRALAAALALKKLCGSPAPPARGQHGRLRRTFTAARESRGGARAGGLC